MFAVHSGCLVEAKKVGAVAANFLQGWVTLSFALGCGRLIS